MGAAGLLRGMLLAVCALVALSAPAFAEPARPVAPGPHVVGVTERTFSRASSTTGEERTLHTLIWYPARLEPGAPRPRAEFGGLIDAPPAAAEGPYPVLVFSHGSGGEPWQSTYVTAHLASHGFVVIAPSHPGNTFHDCPAPCLPVTGDLIERLADSATNRTPDLIVALNETLRLSAGNDPIVAALVDGERVGVLGHSFGGWTALQLAAHDTRVKAVAPLAPGIIPGILTVARGISKPTLLMAGDLDRLARIDQERRLSLALQDGGGEHWFVVLRGAGHLAFADYCLSLLGGCGQRDLPHVDARHQVTGWLTAFFTRHVAGEDRFPEWLSAEPPDYVELTRPVGRGG